VLTLLIAMFVPAAEPPRPRGLATDLAPPVHILVGGEPLDVERSGYAAPCVGDFDGKGRRDLLVGQFDGGKLRLYRNTGTPRTPKFDTYTYFVAGGQTGSVPYG
jgi:hypothetical protein